MKLESITGPDRMGRHKLTFEEGQTLVVYPQVIADCGLCTGDDLDEEQMERLRAAATAVRAKMRAVRIVAASAVSKKDLSQRLVHKGEDPEQAKDAVQWMSDLNLLDDSRVAEQVVQRCISKGYGLQRAKQALYEKKVPKQYWEDALADYPDQSEKIQDFLRSRLGDEYDEREVKRAIDALMRRGHSYGQIRKALNQLKLEQEDFPEDF